jgi:hypothetical protein
MLAPRRASRCSTKDHHDSAIFLWEIVVLDVLGSVGVGRVLWLILPTKVSLHEVTVLHGMLDRSLGARTSCLKQLLEVIPWGTSLWLGRSLIDRHHKVVAAELALFLLFLLWTGSRSFTLFLLGLPLAESDGLFPVGVVSGQVKELADGFRLDLPYLVDKGLARGSILQSGYDLVVGCVGEFSTTLGEVANVVTETLALLLPAMAKLACIVGPRVGSLEVPYEGVPELGPAIDLPSEEVLEPGMC